MRTSGRARAIEAVVFDIGGVLIDWNPRHLFRKLFPHDEAGMEQFLANVCTPEWNAEQDRGRPFAEGIAQLKARHPDRAPLIEAYRERWIEMLDGACIVETASGNACGSALPTSSLARITSRRQRKRTSSPASNIRANQYIPASGSLPRMLLINALAAS